MGDIDPALVENLHLAGERQIRGLSLVVKDKAIVLTRDQIFDQIWDYDFGGESNIIEVYIRYLRSKLEKEREPRLIHTVRGVGYVLRS